MRWASAEIDLGAIEHNVEVLCRAAAPARLWAVVKADGYGHGAVDVAHAALAAGAEGLCVALVGEGVRLRRAGVDRPILVLSQQPPDELPELVEHGLTATVHSVSAAETLSSVAGPAAVDVHVKVDTGMQRVGASPDDVPALLAAIGRRARNLTVTGLFTHLACADDPHHPANEIQLERFDRLVAELGNDVPAIVHVANSAATLTSPRSRRSVVRCGIAVYGISPGPGVDAAAVGLRPAMRLTARVSQVKTVRAGSHVSYGWTHRFDHDTVVATVPIGYADGVPRRLGTLPDRPGADVLVAGRRCPIVGVVTMDQFVVDVGDESVAPGDEVVLIGTQRHGFRSDTITADEWAERLGTIAYEVVCAIGPRVPRTVVRPAASP